MSFNFGDAFKNFENFIMNKVNNNNSTPVNNNDENEYPVVQNTMYGFPKQDDDVEFKPEEEARKIVKYGIPNQPDKPIIVDNVKYAVPNLPDEPVIIDNVKYGIPDQPILKYAMPNLPDEPIVEVLKYAVPTQPTEPTEPTRPTGIEVTKYGIYPTQPTVPTKPTVPTQPTATLRPTPINPTPGNNTGRRWSIGGIFGGNIGRTTPTNPFRFSLPNLFRNIFGNMNNFFSRFFSRW